MTATWTPIWLVQSDLENATNPATIAACFDDNGDGNLNTVAITAVITAAEMEVMSWLGDYGPPPFSSGTIASLGNDMFLKSCAVEFAKFFVFDRHPEYVRSQGKEQADRWKRATDRMERVLDARQRPPQTTTPTSAVGGAVQRDCSTIYLENEGDY